MVKKMLIDATHAEETRVVVVDGNKVEEFDFETVNKRQLAGNIYLAKVTRVEPSLQAAFVDYGGNRHGFLAFAEIHPDYYQIPVADRKALLEEERAMARAEEEEDNRRDRSRSPRPAPRAEAAVIRRCRAERRRGRDGRGRPGRGNRGGCARSCLGTRPMTISHDRGSRARRAARSGRSNGDDEDGAGRTYRSPWTTPARPMTRSSRSPKRTWPRKSGAAPAACPALQDPGSGQGPPDHAGAGRQGRARQQGCGADHLSVAGRSLLRADAEHGARAAGFPARSPRPPTARS